MTVVEGEKLILRCPTNNDADVTWYKDENLMKQKSSRIRVLKQSLKFKYVEISDSGNYACSLETLDTIEWRNVTLLVESLQNDGYQSESSELGSVMGALRPEEETNELDIESRSNYSTRLINVLFYIL